MRMTDCNGRACPYVNSMKYHDPNVGDTPILSLLKNYQEIIGELRHIAG